MQDLETIKPDTMDYFPSIKGPFIWSRVPEITLPLSYPGRGKFSLFLCKINQPFTSGSRTRLRGRDNSGERVVSPRQVGYPWKAGQLFFSPNRDNSLPGEGHVMRKFRIESRNLYQRSENLLGKTHCDRMTEENSKKEGYLYI